jgi:hypothetical protein
MKLLLQRFLVAAAITLVLLSVPIALMANHSWGSYHWARTSNPFTVKLGSNLSSVWQQYLQNTSADWNKSTVLDTTIVLGQAKGRCRPTAGRVEVCNDTYGNNGWLGLAQIWVSGTHITQGAVKLNDTYFNTPTYNTFGWREMVTCQEVGHTFGLDHQDTNFNNKNLGTCMDYTNDPTGTAGTNGTLSNESPNQGDYDELLCIYDPAYAGRTLSTTTHSCTGTGHLDSTTTVGQTTTGNGHMPPAMNQIELTGPEQWGRVIRGSRAQGHELYELDFGGGNKIFTFVTWANPSAQREAVQQ